MVWRIVCKSGPKRKTGNTQKGRIFGPPCKSQSYPVHCFDQAWLMTFRKILIALPKSQIAFGLNWMRRRDQQRSWTEKGSKLICSNIFRNDEGLYQYRQRNRDIALPQANLVFLRGVIVHDCQGPESLFWARHCQKSLVNIAQLCWNE